MDITARLGGVGRHYTVEMRHPGAGPIWLAVFAAHELEDAASLGGPPGAGGVDTARYRADERLQGQVRTAGAGAAAREGVRADDAGVLDRLVLFLFAELLTMYFQSCAYKYQRQSILLIKRIFFPHKNYRIYFVNF